MANHSETGYAIRHCVLVILFGILNMTKVLAQDCPVPTNLYASDVSSCGMTIHWQSTGSILKYTIRYKLTTTTLWSKQINVGTNTSYHFTNLQPSSSYNFQVTAHCTNGINSNKGKITATTVVCSLPENFSVTANNNTSASITVSSTCTYDSLHIRYQTLYGLPQTVSFAASYSYTINELNTDSTYLFQVSTCPLSVNNWTAVDTVHLLLPPPNILIIILDDARNDYYSCNGAPPFFHTPNIDRIANEGVNFKNSFVVTSLCAPSRASIATGLFTTKTGVTVNDIPLDTTFNTIPKFLKSHGYYTALIGKDHKIYLQGSIPEFSFYMTFEDYLSSYGTKYDYNGKTKKINKHQTLTLTDTAVALVQRAPQPFFLQLAYVDPHLPPNPLPDFIGRFDNDVIPWKPDTARYTVNYPSFLYNQTGGLIHGEDLDTTYRHILETISGVDSCIGQVLNALQNSGRLDNTLVIFLSDNGHMMGSHWLSGKTAAYDPSMRIPLFMRYPRWFTAGSIVKNTLALNLDLAPTIYQAAGLQYTDPLDGLSLKDMYDGTTSRNEFYYVMLHDASSADPAKKAIRDMHFKYMRYLCYTDTAEELFDMVNDTLELNNLVNSSSYASTLALYRQKFDSIKVLWDTVPPVLRNCVLSNPVYTREEIEESGETNDLPIIYPTITNGELEIYNTWPSAVVELFNSYGKKLKQYEISNQFTDISLPSLSNGVYFMRMTYADKSMTQKIILQQ